MPTNNFGKFDDDLIKKFKLESGQNKTFRFGVV